MAIVAAACVQCLGIQYLFIPEYLLLIEESCVFGKQHMLQTRLHGL